MRGRRGRSDTRPVWPWLVGVGALLAGSLALVAMRPRWSSGIGLADGLAVGVTLGATGLAGSYDESWDEFWEATGLTYLLGALALLIYLARRERPSAFFVVECAAGSVSYLMLLFVPPLTWLGADLLLFAGTFTGWLLSGLFRPDYP